MNMQLVSASVPALGCWRRVSDVVRMRGMVVIAGLMASCVVGCSSGSASDVGMTCGSTRTGVGVPVQVKIAKGDVACHTAMTVENAYATMVRDGQIHGNGGGAPVTVNGWTCQGYLTPQILQTGDASQCHTGTAEILAVLPSVGSASPSSSATVSPG